MIINCLNKGGVIIYPTDSVYAIGCLVDNLIGLNKIIKFKSNKKSELTLSFLFKNISSTVVDLTYEEPIVLRRGKGSLYKKTHLIIKNRCVIE